MPIQSKGTSATVIGQFSFDLYNRTKMSTLLRPCSPESISECCSWPNSIHRLFLPLFKFLWPSSLAARHLLPCHSCQRPNYPFVIGNTTKVQLLMRTSRVSR